MIRAHQFVYRSGGFRSGATRRCPSRDGRHFRFPPKADEHLPERVCAAELSGPVRRHDAHRRCASRPDDMTHHQQRRIVRPVPIIEYQQDGESDHHVQLILGDPPLVAAHVLLFHHGLRMWRTEFAALARPVWMASSKLFEDVALISERRGSCSFAGQTARLWMVSSRSRSTAAMRRSRQRSCRGISRRIGVAACATRFPR
jgi:hypothetical protein